MIEEEFREMQPRERELVRELLAPSFPGRDELVEQVETASVKTIEANGFLELSIGSTERADHVKYRVPTEGEYEDLDGVTVNVLLHVVHGKASVLELYREDGSVVQSWPAPGALRVFAPE